MHYLLHLLFLTTFLACSAKKEAPPAPPKRIVTAAYTLLIPARHEALLVLFPGFGGNATSIESEATLVTEAIQQDMAVLLMNFNQKLFLTPEEQQQLAELLQQTITENRLRPDYLYLGGISSGGNVALLLGNYLLSSQHPPLKPRGIFVVDAPVDLSSLYYASERIKARNFYAPAVAEASFLLRYLEAALGHPDEDSLAYAQASPYTHSMAAAGTVVQTLKHTPLRLYTEPDLEWHRQHRGNTYEDLNARSLKNLFEALQAAGSTKAVYTETTDRGYGAGRDRHPHSWSIVEEKELLRWIKESSVE